MTSITITIDSIDQLYHTACNIKRGGDGGFYEGRLEHIRGSELTASGSLRWTENYLEALALSQYLDAAGFTTGIFWDTTQWGVYENSNPAGYCVFTAGHDCLKQ